jgi:UDP-glucose 4-epimerase
MNVLVSGGAGFIGSHLAARLAADGHRVTILDNLSTGKRKNILSLLGKGSKVRLLEGDIREDRICETALREVEVVFHLAALGSVPRSIRDPLTTHQVNLTGTLNLLLAAKKARARGFVFASSSSVYGEARGKGDADGSRPKKESQTPSPLSPYAASKVGGEYYCRIFYQLFGLSTVALRYFNVFGPRQDPNSQYAAVIPRFIKAHNQGVPPVIYGDGKQSRDFTYVENVVEANLLASQSPGAFGKLINVACGKSYTLLELADTLNEIFRHRILPRFDPPRPGDIRHSQAEIGLARRLLKFSPAVDFKEGLLRTVRSFKG